MTDAENQIGFEQIGLGSVLKRHHLHVPANQREYSWEERHVTNLLQDFAKAIADDDGPYFLGTIVTIPRITGTLEVVDGQQRLATTAVLLAGIRDFLRKREPIISESLDNEFLTGIDRQRRERVPRLRLNLDDNDFFKARITNSLIQAEATRQSHHRIDRAFSLIRGHIKRIVASYDEKDYGDILNKWIYFIENNALVVLLKVPNDANAFRMFETLNDRGLKTSQADLIKNYLFGRSAERLPEVQQKWTLMRGALESLDNDEIVMDFLRHALIIVRGFVREPQLYERVQDIAKSPQTSVDFVTSLENLSNLYVAIHNPEHEKWNKYSDSARRAIEVLNLFNIRPIRPLMLSIAHSFESKELSKAYEFLTSLGVRLLIAGTTRSGSVEVPIASVAHKVYGGEFTKASEIKTALKDVTPSNDQFATAFAVTTVSSAKLARYYLRCLEMAAKDESDPWHIPNDDRQVINLEHILPRKTISPWPLFQNEDDASAFVNRLGNQALLTASENSKLRSDDFRTKRSVYEQSPYVLTRHIADVNQWGPKEVSDRQDTLAKLAVKAWPV